MTQSWPSRMYAGMILWLSDSGAKSPTGCDYLWMNLRNRHCNAGWSVVSLSFSVQVTNWDLNCLIKLFIIDIIEVGSLASIFNC